MSFFVSSLTDDIFVSKYSAYIQTSRSSPPLQWPPVLVGNPKKIENHRYRSSVAVWTEDSDSCAVGEDCMEELV